MAGRGPEGPLYQPGEKRMQRTYEVMFIVRPDMTDEDLDKLVANLEGQVSTAGGTVKNVERMGKRRLAYVVRKFQDGIYVLMVLEGDGAMVKELERRLRVTEPVIKFITVRVDEEQKRMAKVKALRDAKVRGKGTRAQAAEAAATAAAASAAESAASAATAAEATDTAVASL
jgi:small subunit ribosomal protein S6